MHFRDSFLALVFITACQVSFGEEGPAAATRFNCFELIRFPIIIPGHDKQLSFAINTESSFSRISAEVARHLKRIQDEEKRADGTPLNRDLAIVPKVTIGSIAIEPDRPFVVQDFSKLSQGFDQPIDGYLGMDVLRKMVLIVDMENERAYLKSSVAVEEISDYEPVAIVFTGGVPMVRMTLAELGIAQVVLGLGSANGIVLAEPIVSQLYSRKAFSYSDHLDNTTVPRSERLWLTGRVTTIELGEVSMSNLCVTSNDYHPGLAGLFFLRRYQIVADFPRKVVYLKSNSRSNDPDYTDLFGMWLTRSNGKVVVSRVSKSGNAASVGILANDVLESVNGVKVDGMAYNKVLERIAFPKGTALKLSVRRQQDVRHCEIVLKHVKR